MNCRLIVAAALVALVAIQAYAHPVAKRSCACSLKGSDVCGSPSCIPSNVPRPARQRTPTGMQRVVYQKFAPVELSPKNVCTCEGGLVTAPEVPRVPCKVHAGPARQAPLYPVEGSLAQTLGLGGADCGDNPNPNPCEDAYSAPAPVRTYVVPADTMPAEELVEEVPTPQGPAPVAADAVSLALAYDLATRSQKNIAEENLSFGHMQTPKDGRVIVKKKVVPESGLYAVRNQIVELKAPSGFGRSCEDEAEASLLAAQQATCAEAEDASYGAPLPSYRDLGFAPVNGDCKFVAGQYQPSPAVVQTVEYSVAAPRGKPAGPAFTPCDALASIERGRGSQGYDYYANGAAAEEGVEGVKGVAEGPAPNCGSSGATDDSYPGLNYGPAPAAPAPGHSGRPGCSCGCGY